MKNANWENPERSLELQTESSPLTLYDRAKLLQSCLTLCDPMDCSLLVSSVHGILEARILEWVAMLSSRGSSWPRDWTCISCLPALGGEFFTTSTTWEALKMLTEDYRSAFWTRIVHLLILGAVLAPVASRVASRVLWTECVPLHQI